MGILYGVGVGPGDPELMTLKAVNVLEACPVIAMPDSGEGEVVAYNIARQAVPTILQKELVKLDMPMTRDAAIQQQKRDAAAEQLMSILQSGKDVAFLTLGDPSIYSTFAYMQKRIKQQGGETIIVAGVPSFCAVAATLNEPLVEGAQPLHIIPASYSGTKEGLALDGTKVLMKTGRSFERVKHTLDETGQMEQAKMVQKCGMEDEKIYENIRLADKDASYFSVIVVKDEQK